MRKPILTCFDIRSCKDNKHLSSEHFLHLCLLAPFFPQPTLNHQILLILPHKFVSNYQCSSTDSGHYISLEIKQQLLLYAVPYFVP